MFKELSATVSAFYARAIDMAHRRTDGGPRACCSGAAGGAVIARLAGYGASDVSSLPDAMIEQSFGCGNPLAFAEVRAGETVLDLGCGAGLDLLIAAEKVGPNGWVIGVDMTADMVERARENIRRAEFLNVEVRQGEIERLPVEDDSIDWVISNCVINLSGEKTRVFAEIARVLRPGGRLAVSDMCAESLPEWVYEHADLHAACISGAVPERDYLAGLEAAGLREVQVVGRRVYDASDVETIVEQMLGDGTGHILGGLVSARHLSRALEGRISSVRFAAAKRPAKIQEPLPIG